MRRSARGDAAGGNRASRSVYSVAIRMLAGRDHSVSELRGKLTQRDLPPSEIEETIDCLLDDGYLNDAKFAEVVFRTHTHRGRRGVAAEMKKKGLAPEHWVDLVDQIDDEEELRRALAAGRKSVKPQDLREKPPEVWKRRLFGYLQRRGFGAGTSMRVAEILECEEEGGQWQAQS